MWAHGHSVGQHWFALIQRSAVGHSVGRVGPAVPNQMALCQDSSLCELAPLSERSGSNGGATPAACCSAASPLAARRRARAAAATVARRVLCSWCPRCGTALATPRIVLHLLSCSWCPGTALPHNPATAASLASLLYPWSHPSEPSPLLTPLCACVQPDGQISHEGFLWKRSSFKFQASLPSLDSDPACPLPHAPCPPLPAPLLSYEASRHHASTPAPHPR